MIFLSWHLLSQMWSFCKINFAKFSWKKIAVFWTQFKGFKAQSILKQMKNKPQNCSSEISNHSCRWSQYFILMLWIFSEICGHQLQDFTASLVFILLCSRHLLFGTKEAFTSMCRAVVSCSDVASFPDCDYKDWIWICRSSFRQM